VIGQTIVAAPLPLSFPFVDARPLAPRGRWSGAWATEGY